MKIGLYTSQSPVFLRVVIIVNMLDLLLGETSRAIAKAVKMRLCISS